MHRDGDINTELPVNIMFFSQNMLFVFPPRRYNNRYLVVPTYLVDCLGGMYDKATNMANMYDAMYFSYARNNVNNLVTQIMKIKNVPYNLGYTSLGRCVDSWESYDVYKNYGSGELYKKTTGKSDYNIRLSQSSEKTYRTTNQPRNMDYLLKDYIGESHSDIEKASWKALKVGKYYSLGKHASLSEIQQKFDNRSAVLAFGYQAGRTRTYAFNLISGTDVVIQPDFFDVFDVTLG